MSKRRTQGRELPLCAGSGEGCQWQALPSHVQCEETATRTRDLPVTGGKPLPLAPGSPFKTYTNILILKSISKYIELISWISTTEAPLRKSGVKHDQLYIGK